MYSAQITYLSCMFLISSVIYCVYLTFRSYSYDHFNRIAQYSKGECVYGVV